jgi:DNA-binding protein H-NS
MGESVPPRKSLQTIEAQIRKLQAEAERLKEEEKPGIKELCAVIAKFNLRPADIRIAMKRGKASRRRAKLKPKYRNPSNKAQTWAGRGLKPKWLTHFLKQGKKLEDFAIRRTAA